MELIWAIILSYLLGSVPTAWIVGKIKRGVDIRSEGTGNAGATNVGVVLGAGWGIFVYAVDVTKGILAAWLGRVVAGDAGLALCGLASVVGHDFPIFLGFRGGKGLATTTGVVWILDWRIMVAIYGFWVAGIFVTRYFIVSSLLVFWVLIAGTIYLKLSMWYTIFGILAGVLALQRHWEDLERILSGEEPTAWDRLAKHFQFGKGRSQ